MRLVFSTEARLGEGITERDFLLGDIPGILWIPEALDKPVPLVLLGHPGNLEGMRPRLAARAAQCARDGFAAASIELPGGGARTPIPELVEARANVRRALATGESVDDDVIDGLILPLVERAVPEWRALMDALLAMPEIGGPVAYSGGVISIGVQLVLADERIVAAGLFAGSFIPKSILEDAERVTIPLHVLLQWDDEGNDRQAALDLFDAFGSAEKSLHANMGGHTGVPAHAGEGADGFFLRHLRR